MAKQREATTYVGSLDILVTITDLCKEFAFLKFLLLKVRSISNQSIVDAGSSNITRLPILMPMACQEFVFQ